MIVAAVSAELQTTQPRFLTTVSGKWEGRYLTLEFIHEDGTVFSISHGDGYTAIVGGGVDYRGSLDDSDLIEVLVGALYGGLTYVSHSRFGFNSDRYFEVGGREGQRLGSGWGLAGALPFLLRSIPLLPESVRRARITFDETPAVAAD